jgi:hypothetical protein
MRSKWMQVCSGHTVTAYGIGHGDAVHLGVRSFRLTQHEEIRNG